MIVRKSLLIIAFMISFSPYFAQDNTIGLLYLDQNVSEGYSLFSPEKSTSVFLIDNCGFMVNEWSFTERPGLTAYLLENGNLLRAGKDSLEIRNWDNQLIWSYAITANGLNQHHDIEALPNGNILCIVKDLYSVEDIIEQGRDSNLVENEFSLDKIVELQPFGSDSALVIWEWKFFDHLVQDFDSTKANYAVVSEHPELLDINQQSGFLTDYVHLNAIDYNATLDQLMISARNTSEIYIIDHSTSTEEAGGHSGGNFNSGGDFLWRWGNPAFYDQGTGADQKLSLQHDCKWVNEGFIDENKISVFNNGGPLVNTSSIHLIETSIVDSSYEMEDGSFLPTDFDWSWEGTILGDTLYESKKSAVQSLENGNLLICETSKGQISEITKDGELLWVYKNPIAPIDLNQYDDPTDADNFIFRAHKYLSSYPGLMGQDLQSTTLIEDQNLLSDSCLIIMDVNESEKETITVVNPVINQFIQFNKPIKANKIAMYDANGRLIFARSNFDGKNLKIDCNPGLYILELESNKEVIALKVLVN